MRRSPDSYSGSFPDHQTGERDLERPLVLTAAHASWFNRRRKGRLPFGDRLWSDLQAWTGDAMLESDWPRVGADIVGGTTFNTAFSLSGNAVPEPHSTVGLIIGLGYIAYRRWRVVAGGRLPRV